MLPTCLRFVRARQFSPLRLLKPRLPSVRCLLQRAFIAATVSIYSIGVVAQCELLQLPNPSFEVGNANVMSGWNTFGVVAENTSLVAHGNRSLALSGPYNGGQGISAAWHKMSTAPGEVWEVKAWVGHESSDPLTGAMTAIINIEWRDAADARISYETHVVASQSTPVDIMQQVILTSGAAPAGTTSTHIFLGAFQTPAQESGTVIYDLIEFSEITGPQQEDLQWNDFPGGRTLQFAGFDWRVKGTGLYGPGPNVFSDSNEQIWIDPLDRLHMTVRNPQGTWLSSEIVTEDILGYGDYRLTAVGKLDDWAANVVFGFFHWEYPDCFDGSNPWNLHNEMDMEISRWGDPAAEMAQFVVQPYQVANSMSRFDVPFSANTAESAVQLTTFAYQWFSDRIEFRVWAGDAYSESAQTLIHSWTYTGPYIPREHLARVHLNLWQFSGPPSNGEAHEIILTDFVFVPEGAPEPFEGWVPVPVAFLALLASLLMLITVGFYRRTG